MKPEEWEEMPACQNRSGALVKQDRDGNQIIYIGEVITGTKHRYKNRSLQQIKVMRWNQSLKPIFKGLDQKFKWS